MRFALLYCGNNYRQPYFMRIEFLQVPFIICSDLRFFSVVFRYGANVNRRQNIKASTSA